MDNNTLYFSEAQPFRMWWVWLIVLGISFFFVGAFVRQVLLGYPVGSNPSSDGVLIVGALLSLVLVALFWFMRLETHIGSEGIYTRFFSFIPFKKRSWGSIQELRIRRYSPVGEYGGWGIRGFGSNRALNVSGNIGLQIWTVSGNRLLIGTKQPQAMDEALRQIPILSGVYLPLSPDFNE